MTSRKRKKETVPQLEKTSGRDSNDEDSLQFDNRPKKPDVLRRSLAGRVVGIILVLGLVYISSTKKDDSIPFALENAVHQRKSHQVPCSSDYATEEEKFKACSPKICGRIVMDTLISPEEVKQLLRLAKKGLSYGGSDGGASILDLHSGALSKGQAFVNIFKLPDISEIITPNDVAVYRNVKNKIQQKIAMEFGSLPTHLYLTHPTFFSRITPQAAKTAHDEYWHIHVDKETYPSFHYTSLLYLNNYSKDFTGGRFVFVDKNANHTVEPKSGRVSMFTSGSENLHCVEKVSSGVRYALTVSFTCDKNFAIEDPHAIH